MPKSTLTVIALAALLAGLGACRKDVALEEEAAYAPTPYEIPLPAWVLDSIGPMPIPPDNPTTVEGVHLGRMLFHEKALSGDGTMSCATCHVQSSGFGDPRAVSTGITGVLGKRNAMALVNLGWSRTLFWDGRRSTLEEQAHDPVSNPVEMAADWSDVVDRLQADARYPELFFEAFGTRQVDSILVVKAIAQFERTLVSFGSRFDRFYYGGDDSAITDQEREGFELFVGRAKCAACHTLGLTTDDSLRVVGLELMVLDQGVGALTGLPQDIGRFKVPTLRNIAASGPYMHNGSQELLRESVQFYNSHLEPVANIDTILLPFLSEPLHLTLSEQAALEQFLHTFTDPGFLTDPAFGPPH